MLLPSVSSLYSEVGDEIIEEGTRAFDGIDKASTSKLSLPSFCWPGKIDESIGSVFILKLEVELEWSVSGSTLIGEGF